MALWRIHTRTDSETLNVGQYCIDNNVAVLGWSFKKNHVNDYLSKNNITPEEFEQKRKDIGYEFKKYTELADQIYKKYASVNRFHEVEKDDLLWMRCNGKYYLGRVTETTQWYFNPGEDEERNDVANQLTDIHWYPASETADESAVPGAVTTAFIKGSAFQRINKPGVEDYSKLLYNDICKGEYKYSGILLKKEFGSFYNLLQPADLEDLVCMYLYKKYKYITIPSTNKISTPLYECVLLDPENKDGKNTNIYIQVKKGKVDLRYSDYEGLNGKVFLLTTEGSIEKDVECNNIESIKSDELYNFAVDENNRDCIPEKIRKWIELLEKYDSSKICNKGVILDTNKSYSSTNEDEMLESSQICAYGSSKRYVNSLNKGDYALFYSKGNGVVAIGKVITDKYKTIEDGLAHEVEFCVPANGFPREKCYLRAHEINKLLGHRLFYASTMKVPFLTEEESIQLIKELKKKYGED